MAAAQIRDQLNSVPVPNGDGPPTPPSGWQGLGVPEWLADRVERLGFMLPTDIQRQTTKLMTLGADVFLSAQTGSGKTLAFLIPVLAMLDYQPGAYAFLPRRNCCCFQPAKLLCARLSKSRHTIVVRVAFHWRFLGDF